MKIRPSVVLLRLSLGLAMPFFGARVWGQVPDSVPPPVTFSGTIDAYFSWNFARPASHANLFRNFDITENQIVVSNAEVDVQKATSATSPFGFTINASVGSASDVIHGLPNTPSPSSLGSINLFQQAYLTYVVPVGAGLTVDAGKFVTHMGNELIRAKDNMNYSRSFLFAYAIPYYHVGIRALYPFRDNLSVCVHMLDCWNGVPANQGKTFGATITFTPIPTLTLLGNYIGGPSQPETVSNVFRNVGELVATLQANDKLTLAADGNYGTDSPAGTTLSWYGVAGYARYAVSEKSAFALRGEVYSDPDGYTTGTAQHLKEATLTFEHKPVPGLILRTEFRYDWSTVDVFVDKDGAPTSNQSTLAAAAIVVF
jgi:hypothetical protein